MYANDVEDEGVAYWFPTLMKNKQEENLGSLQSQL